MSILMWVKFLHIYSYCLQRLCSLFPGVQVKKCENDWLHVGRKMTEFYLLSFYVYDWIRTIHITILHYVLVFYIIM